MEAELIKLFMYVIGLYQSCHYVRDCMFSGYRLHALSVMLPSWAAIKLHRTLRTFSKAAPVRAPKFISPAASQENWLFFKYGRYIGMKSFKKKKKTRVAVHHVYAHKVKNWILNEFGMLSPLLWLCPPFCVLNCNMYFANFA